MLNFSKQVAIKVCGITNVADAAAAVEAGADILGFNFCRQSPRFVTAQQAAEAIEASRQLDRTVQHVGVFVDEEIDSLRELAEKLALDAVQLHGSERPEYLCSLAPIAAIKVLRVGNGMDFAGEHVRDVLLLDTWQAGQYGGTGIRFDWKVAAKVRKRVGRLILAGGLDAQNVGEAIRLVHPDGVDVCSGVELSPRRKDRARMQDFVRAVRRASPEVFS